MNSAYRNRQLIHLTSCVNEIVEDELRFLRHAGVTDPVKWLAKHLGISNISVEDIPCEGLLMPEPNGYSVKLSHRSSSERRRFSLAHELGHVVLQKHGLGCKEEARRTVASASAAPNRTEERFCDAFAAVLLMPEKAFQQEALRCGCSLNGFRRLAKRFNVSLSAAARRYRELMPCPDFSIATMEKREAILVKRVHVNFCVNPIRPGMPVREHPPLREAFERRTTVDDYIWLKAGRTARRLYLKLEAPRSSVRTIGLLFKQQPTQQGGSGIDTASPRASFAE